MDMTKLMTMILISILLTSCATSRYSVKQACGSYANRGVVKLGLNLESTIADYRRALITRKAELNLRDKDIQRILACVDKSTKG